MDLAGSDSRARRTMIGVLVFLNVLVVLALTSVAFHIGSRRTSSTSDLAQEGQLLVAAFGFAVTSVLAWITAYYAYVTRGILKSQQEMTAAAQAQLTAAERELAIAESARAAAIAPWLSSDRRPVHLTVDGSVREGRHGVLIAAQLDGLIRCVVALRNIGNGLAVIAPGEVKLLPSRLCTQAEAMSAGRATRPACGAGDTTELRFQLNPNSAAWTDLMLDDFTGRPGTNGEFRVHVTYTDATGGQRVRAELDVAGQVTSAGPSAPPEWLVWRTRYYRDGEDQPFIEAQESLLDLT